MKVVMAVMFLLLSQDVPALSQAPQPPADPGNPASVLSAFLGFSEPQTTQFAATLNAFQNVMRDLQLQMESKQRRFQELLALPQPDLNSIGQAVLEIRALQMQSQRAGEDYRSAFATLLTPDQLQRVQMVIQARQLLPAVGLFAALGLVEAVPAQP